jgi:VIT1/CCC1 family predicted Fe2+/Mn2+ transporter
MIDAGFHVLIYTAIFFALGMFKPQWPLFFLKQPSRFIIVAISTIGLMIGWTLFGEGHKQEQMAKKKAEQSVEITTPAASELPAVK